MTEKDHDDGWQFLRRAGFGEHLNDNEAPEEFGQSAEEEGEEGEGVYLYKETTEMDPKDMAEFLLGERESAENFFRAQVPVESGGTQETYFVRVKEKEDQYITFGEDVDDPDSIFVEVVLVDGKWQEEEQWEISMHPPTYCMTVHRSKVLSVRFERMEIKVAESVKRIWNILIEKEGGHYTRIFDTGQVNESDEEI